MSDPKFPSDHPSAKLLVELRSRVRDLLDDVAAWRWRLGAIVVLLLVGAAGWGLTQAGSHGASSPSSSSSSDYQSRSYSTSTTADGAGATPTTAATAQLVVYAAGAVKVPGIYSVVATARVSDVVAAAGGLADDADPDQINLAAKVTDGERVFVVRKGQAAPADAEGVGGSNASGPVNINDASAAELDALPGVGPSTAAAIVQYRTQHGPFGAVSDLAKVKGIGPSKLAQIKDAATV